MKKFFIPLFFAIIIGFFFGKTVFDQYKKGVDAVFKSEEKIYFLQQGAYSSEENAKSHASLNTNYIIVNDGTYYRVYLGITKNEKDVDKVKEVLTNAGNDIYVRELSVSNSDFLTVIEQYDKLLDVTNNDSEILEIEKQVLGKYKELVVGNE